MSSIVKMYDASNNDVYPITHLRAVRDSNGTTLESMIQGVNETTVGYYECTTAGSTPEKTITIDSSVSLSVRISCKVKFAEKNTGANATMNINNTGAKPLFYNGVRAAANNSWYTNEIVDLYFDGTNYQAKSCADTLEYDVSLHQTHEITEVTTTTRTVVYNGDVTSGWENETSVSDSSVNGYTRTETNTGKDNDTTTVDGPTANYDSASNKTSVVYVTKRTLTHVVNDYTFDEAVNAVPMSYRHGGLKLRFISNSNGSVQNSDNKYVQYRLMKNTWSTTVSDWQGVDDEPVVGSENLVKSGGVAYSINQLKNSGYFYAGIATPITNPGTLDVSVFYIANGKGTYTNFGGLEVTEDEVVVLYWDSSWHKVSTGIAPQAKLSELEAVVNGYPSKLFTTLGQRYTTDGSLISDSGAGTTDIIPLSIFGDYKNNGIRLLSGIFRMYHEGNYCLAVFFDSAKTFVGFSQYAPTLSSLTPLPSSEIPPNAEYIAFSGLVTQVTTDLFDVEFVVYNKGVVGEVDKVKGDIVDINNSLVSTNESLKKLRKDVDNGFGGVLVGFDVFDAENVFTLKGKARNKDTGEEYDYTYANISPLMYLEYLRNSEGDIELIQGEFRGSSFGVAFFYDANGEYIGYDGSTITYSKAYAFQSSLIPVNAVYVSFLQYDNQSSVTFYTYNKPISKYNDLKIRMGITEDYPIVVTPNMTPKAFYQAVNAQMGAFAEANKTYSHSFLSILDKDFNYTWESVLSIVSKNLRQDIGDVNTPMNIVCENVNKALTERIYRFYDAKPLSNAERDASLTTGLNKGEPSVIISDDGGTMYIYGNGQRISTTDGVKWTDPIDIVKSDSRYTLHESINYIDGVYYLIAPIQNFGGTLELYTSVDGINFEYKGKLFLESTILDGTNPVVSWGNPYLIKNYGDGKFYLYIETQESNFGWRIHLVTFDDFSTENADGTIGARTIYENNPIIQRPFDGISLNYQSAGNPDFFKIEDNRPIKVDNKYFMMFHSGHLSVAHLFRASSYDLIHWNIDGIMWDNRDQPSGGDETNGNADACVIEFKGRTYLFYTHDINQEEKGIEHIKYTIDDRPLSELLKLLP